jgi:hypothetical protein
MLNCFLIYRHRTQVFSLFAAWFSDSLLNRELTRRDIDVKQQNAEPQILLPLEVMVHPLDLRFKYHFSGDKPTNRLDKV